MAIVKLTLEKDGKIIDFVQVFRGKSLHHFHLHTVRKGKGTVFKRKYKSCNQTTAGEKFLRISAKMIGIHENDFQINVA